MTRETSVRKHPKKRTTGRFNWKTHNRVIEDLEKRKRPMSRNEVERKYKSRGYYQPSPLMAYPHGSDSQWVKQNIDGTQDHSRIYEKEKHIEVEEHTDLESPEKNPIGHVVVDVGEVTLSRELEGKNENRTKTIRIKKKVEK